jgi:hypothetical protein
MSVIPHRVGYKVADQRGHISLCGGRSKRETAGGGLVSAQDIRSRTRRGEVEEKVTLERVRSATGRSHMC